MSRSPVLATLAATVLAGFTLAVVVLLGADPVLADERRPEGAPHEWTLRIAREPVDPRQRLDASDELATMGAVQTALMEVADGSTYVWYRGNGRLSGQFKPTISFRDAAGRVCRHLEITLVAGYLSRTREGVACRRADGVWVLEG
jgi:hypothetical protein